MMQFYDNAQNYQNAEKMAQDYLAEYIGNERIEYPINPFKMLKDEGILFSFMKFKKLEGVYIPANGVDDSPTVGINADRPITRQRFTAAHELCHHFRDANKQISCPIGSKNQIEKFADSFAAALLMPIKDLRYQVNKRKNRKGNISFDDVLDIADYFGVSFESCLYRVAYQIHAISGNTEIAELKKRIADYKPDKVRRSNHMTYTKLYEDLIDSYQDQLGFIPSDHSKYVYQNEYIYNDSRFEGLDVTPEQASEIVTDLRLNTQNSVYCNENNEAFLSIAGHYDMYQDIFVASRNNGISVYDMIPLNKKLFSHYPHPEFGGSIRQTNNLVIGAKFETSDYHDIFQELEEVDGIVREFYDKKDEISISDYVKHVARVHHRITVIHPFADGNGRTSRAFMNMQFIKAGMVPIYIKSEDRKHYLEALARADKENDYDELYEIVFRLLLRNSVELNRQ